MESTIPAPLLNSPYTLSQAQIDSYRKEGHVKLSAVAGPEEVAFYGRAIREAAMRHNHETRSLEERDTYGKAFLQVMNLWVNDPVVKQYVLAKRFAKIAADLMGVESVRLYHDQALFKEAGGGFTPWHQDQHYWPLDTDKTVTMWMPLVDANTAMGTMRFASGSHAEGYLGDMPISDESEAQIAALLAEKGYPIVESGAMKAGDATFHTGWTLHGAPGNSSSQTREVMTIIYFADGTRVGSADNANRQNDLAGWLPGLKPGDLAASELNPRVG
jgi:ectoine hydroxylase-related dioxygenase (phytanoyl-CoA dioxygenase family)